MTQLFVSSVDFDAPDLPIVRGRYHFDASLKNLTWFSVGGAADILFKPKDTEDLSDFLKTNTKDHQYPVFVLGAGSNIIVRDGGVRGVVIRLAGSSFSGIHIEDNIIEVGAGALDRTVSLTCQSHGLGGLEFFIGIPGTIGGALAMNAGAYGFETKDRLLWAEAISPDGQIHRLTPKDMGFSYRHCSIPKDWIFTKAAFLADKEDPSVIQDRLTDILARRQATQPVKGRTGGSTFKNPSQDVSDSSVSQARAWELIDAAGCRGMMVGDAMMSELHCNFMMNLGNASAQDLEELGERVRRSVFDTTGVQLSWEILRVGEVSRTTTP